MFLTKPLTEPTEAIAPAPAPMITIADVLRELRQAESEEFAASQECTRLDKERATWLERRSAAYSRFCESLNKRAALQERLREMEKQ
jgi:hypothetical protein